MKALGTELKPMLPSSNRVWSHFSQKYYLFSQICNYHCQCNILPLNADLHAIINNLTKWRKPVDSELKF